MLRVIQTALAGIASGLVIASLSACGGDEVAATASESSAPKPCEKNWVKAETAKFVSAMDSGSRSQLEAAVARKQAFREFSYPLTYRKDSGRTRFFATEKRGVLIDQLVKRRGKGDRISVVSIQVGDYDRSFKLCNVGFTVSRRIGDGPRRKFLGKGALDESSGGVAVWNIGGRVGGM